MVGIRAEKVRKHETVNGARCLGQLRRGSRVRPYTQRASVPPSAAAVPRAPYTRPSDGGRGGVFHGRPWLSLCGTTRHAIEAHVCLAPGPVRGFLTRGTGGPWRRSAALNRGREAVRAHRCQTNFLASVSRRPAAGLPEVSGAPSGLSSAPREPLGSHSARGENQLIEPLLAGAHDRRTRCYQDGGLSELASTASPAKPREKPLVWPDKLARWKFGPCKTLPCCPRPVRRST